MFGLNKKNKSNEANDLAELLKKHRANLNIDKNGFVSLDLNSKTTREALEKEFKKLEGIQA